MPQHARLSPAASATERAATLPTAPPEPAVFPPLAHLHFGFRAEQPLRLPAYTGSAWHGVLGHALRGAVCVTGQRTCAGCLLTGTCAYAVLFESPPTDPALAARYRALPHPYVLETEPPAAPRELPVGAGFALGMTLIGSATAYLPHLVYALRGAGALGFGEARARFALSEVAQEQTLGADDWRVVYAGGALTPATTATPGLPPCPAQVHIRLLTPLRLKARKHYVRADELTGADLIRALGQRAELLLRLYAPPGSPAEARWTDARAALAGVHIAARDLRWHDWTRCSNRQETRMQLGGLLGELTLAGPALAQAWPLLWIGQWLHAGKNTAFGLGRYRVAAAGAATAPPPSSP
jgi:hypothetical protein